MGKKMQIEIYKELEKPSHQWMKCNINPAKVRAIINMQELMIETRAQKRNRGLVVDTDLCRLCGEVPEGVMYITSGCKMLASRESMKRYNNLLKILMVAWCKKNELMERDEAWYKVKWGQGAVLENEHVNMSWDFEYNMRKELTARRPDVTIEFKERRVLHLVYMACPSEKNVLEKKKEKKQKYQQL